MGDFRITADAIDVILASKDYVGAWIKHLDQGRARECPQSLKANEALLARIHGLLTIGAAEVAQEEPPGVAVDAAPATPEDPPPTRNNSREQRTARESSRSVKVDTAKLDYLVDMVGEMIAKYVIGIENVPSWIAIVHSWVYAVYLVLTFDLSI